VERWGAGSLEVHREIQRRSDRPANQHDLTDRYPVLGPSGVYHSHTPCQVGTVGMVYRAHQGNHKSGRVGKV
jgi:hypothetical protein